jgi:hypothetical protein
MSLGISNLDYKFTQQVMRLNQSRRIGQTKVARPQYDQFGNNEMYGEGFADVIRGIYNKGKSAASYVWDNRDKIADAGRAVDKAYTSEVGTMIRNALPDSDDTARPGFAGERHMILELPNGKNGVANYMGPGTRVLERLKRGDPPRTSSDRVAMRHDIDYQLAKGEPNKKKQLDAVRTADKRMINSLKAIQAGRLGERDQNRNIQAGLKLIQAKNLSEDMGLIDKSKFIGDLKKISNADKILLLSERAGLSQAGYGLPGDELKSKLLKKLRRSKIGKKGKGCCMTGKGYKSQGLEKVISSLSKAIGVKIPMNLIKKIGDLSNKPSGDLSNHLAKTLMPIIAHGKLKSMGHSLAGPAVMKLVKSPGMKPLHTLLDKSLKKAFQMSGKGLNLPGGGFWSDFASGFKSVFKPASKILAPALSMAGLPEFGVPLGIAGSLM